MAMVWKTIAMSQTKRIALVAHDHKKQDLLEWAKYNQTRLAQHELYSTGTTGKLLERELNLPITKAGKAVHWEETSRSGPRSRRGRSIS